MMKEAKKKGCLKASMFFYFYPACFPTFCHLNPISGWLNHVNLQRLMVFTSILQAFMLVSQPPKSECWLMSIHLNQFQSIYIYICVCVCFRLKTCRKTWKIPRFSQHFPLFPRPGAAPGLRSAGASADTVGPVLFGARSGKRLKWGNVWDPWGKCDESGWSMVNLWLINNGNNNINISGLSELWFTGWWFGTWFLWFHMLGMSSFQLTKSYFSEG